MVGGKDLQVLPTDTTVPRPDVEGLPWLVYEAAQPDLEAGRKLRRQKSYKARRLLTSIGIPLKPYIAGRGPKAGAGVLIVDEASMVGASVLEDCQRAYPQVVLVGDPGQLPPVGDTPVLATVPGIALEELHRQAAASPIVTLAYAARQGEPFWEAVEDDPLAVGVPVRMVDEVAPDGFSPVRCSCGKMTRVGCVPRPFARPWGTSRRSSCPANRSSVKRPILRVGRSAFLTMPCFALSRLIQTIRAG